MSEAAEESPAQRAARLRREKREKKILEGGGDRLAKITNVSGRGEDLQPKPPPRPTVAEDPGDVDIPHIPKALRDGDRGADDPPVSVPSAAGPTADDDLAQFRQALRSQPGGGPGGPGGEAGAEDPLMKLMQQMMGMAGQGGQGAAGMGGFGTDGAKDGAAGPQLPPALASLLGGQSMPQGTAAAAPPTNAYIWQVVHALFALGLGLYMALVLPFTGGREERLAAEVLSPSAPTQRVFWIFTTAELALQSTRFMLERRQGGGPIQGGMVGTVAGFLPEPYRGRLLLAARYFAIWTTLVQDVMVAVFVLGVVAWWKDDL